VRRMKDGKKGGKGKKEDYDVEKEKKTRRN
jgi:hypothetical protein